tara:strand:- start:1984 stop:2934 length:951 start_codon:yes stop_codon:yes gene_type:complete
MQFRKIIKFGNNSFVISLPKSWIEQNKLKKGDTVQLDETGDDLHVLTKRPLTEEATEIIIDIANKDPDCIKREVTAAYINGHATITLLGKRSAENEYALKKNLHSMIALEILEQTETKMVARCFLNMKEISIENSIRRMDNIIRSMFADTKKTMDEDNHQLIYIRDEDVNRLNFLSFRTIKFLLDNPNYAKSINISPQYALNMWQIVTNLESVADQIKRIARDIHKSKMSSGQKKDFLEIFKRIDKHYTETMTCFYKKNQQTGLVLANKKKGLVEGADGFFKKYLRTAYLPSVSDKLKTLILDIHKITRVVYGGAG